MTRRLISFLILLFTILGNSQISKADNKVPLIGNRAVIYKGPWNNFTPSGGTRHYSVTGIPQSYQLALQITNFDTGIASVTLSNMYCSIDPTVNDFDTASSTGKFTNITFSANGVNTASAIIILAGGNVAASGSTITTPTLPCSSITLEFSSATQVSTNVEIVATFSTLVLNQTGINGGISAGSNAGNVQGISANGSNGGATFPLVDGGLQPAINAGFTNFGVDSLSQATGTLTNGLTATLNIGNPPIPSSSTDWGLAVWSGFGGTGGTGLNAPWVCIPAIVACGANNSTNLLLAQMSSPIPSQPVTFSVSNSNATTNTYTHFVLFNKTPTAIRQSVPFGSAVATLSGSTLLVAVQCLNAPGIINSITDSQGNKWTKLTDTNSTSAGSQIGGLSIWFAGPSAAAAETITITPNAGTTVSQAAFLELTGTSVANPNRRLVPVNSTNSTFSASENDIGGQTVAPSGYSFTETRTISGAGTVTIPLWQQSQHGAFLSSCGVELRVTAISGTTPTLNTYLQDAADNAGFNDRASFTQIIATGNWYASVSANAGTNSVVTTDGTMTVTTRLDGSIGPFGRLKFILGGTTPSVTMTYNVHCQ